MLGASPGDSSEAQAKMTMGRKFYSGQWKPGALQNESIGRFVARWRSQVGVHLQLELRRKGVWGQTLRIGLSFLPVSLSKIMWCRQPRL